MAKSLKDYFNISNITNFVNGTYNSIRDEYNMLPLHIKEQAMYRAILCNDCLINKKCSHCGCEVPDMFYGTLKKDGANKWDKMLSAEEWNDFKNTLDKEHLIFKVKNMQDVIDYFTKLKDTNNEIEK